MEVIRTGKPVPKDLQAKQIALYKELFDEAWANLGPRGRVQLGSEFMVWIQERRRELQRLDMTVARRNQTG